MKLKRNLSKAKRAYSDLGWCNIYKSCPLKIPSSSTHTVTKLSDLFLQICLCFPNCQTVSLSSPVTASLTFSTVNFKACVRDLTFHWHSIKKTESVPAQTNKSADLQWEDTGNSLEDQCASLRLLGDIIVEMRHHFPEDGTSAIINRTKSTLYRY